MGRGVNSREHDEAVMFVAKTFNAEIVTINGRGYFPDAKDETTDYEVEIAPKKRYLENKAAKWDAGRRRILILAVPDFVCENFEEIYFKNHDGLKRLFPANNSP